MDYMNADGFVITVPEIIRAQGPIHSSLAEAESDLPRLTALIDQEVARLGQLERARRVEAIADFASGNYFARGQVRLWPPGVTPQDVENLSYAAVTR